MIDANVLKTVLTRKGLHFLVALAPTLAALCFPLAVAALAVGTVFYAFAECLRLEGGGMPLVSRLTALASHGRDRGRFVLGPVTLGAGALFSLLVFRPEAFEAAMFALAFGDGFAGLVGRFVGRVRPGFLLGKSVEGSLACFAMIGVWTFVATGNGTCALVAACVGCVVEALPAEDFDNVLIPLAVGVIASFGLGV
jgi:dolichol kinase